MLHVNSFILRTTITICGPSWVNHVKKDDKATSLWDKFHFASYSHSKRGRAETYPVIVGTQPNLFLSLPCASVLSVSEASWIRRTKPGGKSG
ncbi:hypothetical protein HYALB_00004290 [Hymenoscyphus albidus]|uniref:Uncharacterized protein n=1 Tax=Hymenoscyphus albidus TaxID=595503 RepID=A0A9N9LHD6_9HELO|nr:hypothetical protein HYALB_00004290 [Hymenoscyphus albidus]